MEVRHKGGEESTCASIEAHIEAELGGCDLALNQYWYSEITIETLSHTIEETVGSGGGRVAFLSTPSLFFAVSEEVRSEAVLLEFDHKWDSHSGFRFYNFHEGVGAVQGTGDLLGQFKLCVIDPPYIDKAVWEKYITASDALLAPGGQLLMTTIPENEAMLRSACAKFAVRDWDFQSHRFTPVNLNCVHKFAVFTTFASAALEKENTEAVPESQGLGQQSGQQLQADDDDEVLALFGDLQSAVISMTMDYNDSEHESESDEEAVPEYEFCKKAQRVMRKGGFASSQDAGINECQTDGLSTAGAD